MRKEVFAILAIALAFFVFVTPGFSSSSSSDSSANYWHPYPSGIIPGDLVIGHSDSSDWYIPGYWTHIGIIGWYDSNINDWIVIEAYNPIELVSLKDFMKRYDTVAVLRVNTNDAIRQAAVSFAYQQLGKPYDYEIYTKHVYGDKYYCSELVWAAYKAVGGPDIDKNPGWSWTYAYGVAPQEIYDDGDTYTIYYHSDA